MPDLTRDPRPSALDDRRDGEEQVLDRAGEGRGRAVVLSDDPAVSVAVGLTRRYAALLVGGLAGSRVPPVGGEEQ